MLQSVEETENTQFPRNGGPRVKWRPNLDQIDRLKQQLQQGDVDGVTRFLQENQAENKFRALGQALLWQRDFKDFDRLLQIGLTLRDGEALVLDLGLQLLPDGLSDPNRAWASPPLSEQLTLGYGMVATALAAYPEPAAIFSKVVVMHQEAVARQASEGSQLPTD